MKKSLLYVILLFIAWAVSAAAIQTPPSAILRLEAAVCNNVFGLHSRYTMKYAVNRLSSMEIEREGEDYEGRTGVGATGKISDFWYDANGNLGRDLSRGILSTNYNRLDLPTDVYFINGHRQTIEYDGFGQKRSVAYSQTSDPILGSMMGVPEDSAYTLQGRREYIGPHVFVGDSLEYSAFSGGYFSPEGVFYYITDWQGNNIAVFSDGGKLVQQTTYYPYGEPTIEPTGQRYLFGGKEREHAGGRNSYDYGPRSLGPSGNWNSADRKATENYPISPFSYCNGDPINHIDNDGNLPIPLAMFLIGAGIDFTTQVSINLISGQSFFDAIGNVDVTSVVKSGVTSALLGPMSSKGLKIGVTVIAGATDAAAAVNIDGTIKYLGGEGECKKELFEAGVDFTANTLPSFVKHSPKSSSTLKYSTPKAVGKDWTEQELNTTTEILFNGSAKALNEHFRTEKNKQMKNNRPQIVEPNDAIQANPTPYPDPILNKRGFYEKLF